MLGANMAQSSAGPDSGRAAGEASALLFDIDGEAGVAHSHQTAALRPVVRAVIAAVLGERATHPDVEDCTHEALRRAIEGRGRLRAGEPLRPWVLGIARHVALDLRRARKRARGREATGFANEDGAIDNPLDRVADAGPAPDERAETNERARRIREALDALSEGQRKAMMMFHTEGRGYQEIAAELGVPMGTVATWLSRGRRTIAEALGEQES
jgi:RNA polymerase sigma-70 factor (ECF subfamily)